jgi:ABC-2 type transport system permease protein
VSALGAVIATDTKEAWRDRRLPLLFLLCMALAILAGWSITLRHATQDRERVAAEAQDRRTWLQQGAANPHTIAHFGHYAFKPLSPLAAFDPGLTPYLGSAIWMEAHWQNPANARAAEDMLEAQRFADLTPAWMLQVVAPLVILALGFALLARERETGLWRAIAVSGLSPGRLLVLRFASLVVLSACALSPLVAASFAAPVLTPGPTSADHVPRTLVLVGVYALYLLAWVGVTLAVSALARSSRAALAVLAGVWALTVVILPRMAISTADRLVPVPTAQAFRTAMEQDIAKGLDGHNDKDARLAALKEQTLQQYGLAKVEDLPVSFAGIALQAAEDYGDQVFDRHFGGLYQAYEDQRRSLRFPALLSPVLAVRQMSALLAGTDERHHRHFAHAAELHRRLIIRQLNDDMIQHGARLDFAYAADPALWRAIPEFTYRLPSLDEAHARPALWDLLVLAGWLLGGLLLAAMGVMRWSRA